MIKNFSRKEYFQNYYQNNKDKYTKDQTDKIRYCELCDKNFNNITRHLETRLHTIVSKYVVSIVEVGGNILIQNPQAPHQDASVCPSTDEQKEVQ